MVGGLVKAIKNRTLAASSNLQSSDHSFELLSRRCTAQTKPYSAHSGLGRNFNGPKDWGQLPCPTPVFCIKRIDSSARS